MFSFQSRGDRVAIMQPYFFPYLGYFRLLKMVDVMVWLTDVQFPRRGWVHRNRIRNTNRPNKWQYFGIPVMHAPQKTPISLIKTANDGNWQTKLSKTLKYNYSLNTTSTILRLFTDVIQPPNDLIGDIAKLSITKTCHLLRLDQLTFIDSNTFKLPQNLTYTDRIFEILSSLKADRYYNLPGGKLLYDRAQFKKRGIQLHLLEDMESELNSSSLGMLSVLDPLSRGMISQVTSFLEDE